MPGWLTTEDLSKTARMGVPDLPEDLWDPFAAQVKAQLAAQNLDQGTAYFYAIHDLEYIATLLDEARKDAAPASGAHSSSISLRTGDSYSGSRAPRLLWFRRGSCRACAPNPRGSGPRAPQLSLNLWLWRIRQRDFCPPPAVQRRRPIHGRAPQSSNGALAQPAEVLTAQSCSPSSIFRTKSRDEHDRSWPRWGSGKRSQPRAFARRTRQQSWSD